MESKLTAKERWDWYQIHGDKYGCIKLISLIINENEEDNNHVHKWLDNWAPNVPKYKNNGKSDES